MSLADVASVVGVNSSGCPTKKRITAGDPAASYLVDKLMGASQTPGGCFAGMRMPRNGTPLSAADMATITGWISAGAN